MTKVVVSFKRVERNAGLPKLHGNMKISSDIAAPNASVEVSVPITVDIDGSISIDAAGLKLDGNDQSMHEIKNMGRGILLMWLSGVSHVIGGDFELEHPIIICTEFTDDGEYTLNAGVNWHGYTPKDMEWRDLLDVCTNDFCEGGIGPHLESECPFPTNPNNIPMSKRL